ncbi:hypothetical protein KDL44_10790 [bacterium]|nr:hypothetical protein [bacterium]
MIGQLGSQNSFGDEVWREYLGHANTRINAGGASFHPVVFLGFVDGYVCWKNTDQNVTFYKKDEVDYIQFE